MLRGEVHDENAHAMGGVAPHAGLFGTAEDLARFAQMMLNGGVFEHRRLASRATLEKFIRRAGVPGSSHALGWDTPSGVSSAGTLMSREAFGHLGFTGTSLWIDASRKLFVILLTNRVHPKQGEPSHPRSPPGRRGRCGRGASRALAVWLFWERWCSRSRRLSRARSESASGSSVSKKKRASRCCGSAVGLIAHAASVTWDGRHALDVLRGVGVDVRRAFAPEHGWHSEAAAGAHIDGRV